MVNQRGQSLVEIAIAAPLLIFLMIGVLEVGYVIRNQLILDNIAREGARYAARPGYVEVGNNGEIVGGIEFLRHVDGVSSASAVFPSLAAEGWVVLNIVSTDVMTPCDKLYLDPTVTTWQFPENDPVEPVIDIDTFAIEQSARDEQHACDVAKTGNFAARITNQHVVVSVEVDHRQLFGFPLISNPYTDPVRLRSYTAMRKIVDRTGD